MYGHTYSRRSDARAHIVENGVSLCGIEQPLFLSDFRLGRRACTACRGQIKKEEKQAKKAEWKAAMDEKLKNFVEYSKAMF